MLSETTHDHSTYSTWKWWNSFLVDNVVVKINKDDPEMESFKDFKAYVLKGYSTPKWKFCH